MKRKEIKDLIRGWLMPYGKGYSYECQLNGNYIDGTNQLKSEASEGDEVEVDVFQGHQKQWSDGHLFDRLRFRIELNGENEEVIERYRNLHNTSVYAEDPDEYQRQKLYRWERRFVDGFKVELNNKTEEGAEAFLKPVFDKFPFDAPAVKHHAGRDSTCSYHSFENEIRIGDWGYSKAVLIHEAAHAVVDKLGIEAFVSSHGPFFASVYVELLSRHLAEDKTELKRGLEAWGVEYIENFSLERWVRYYENDDKLEIPEINRVRKDNNVLRDGTKLNESQKETLKNIRKDFSLNSRDIDGRSARALVNRDLVDREEGSYKLTERGEKALENIRNEIV